MVVEARVVTPGQTGVTPDGVVLDVVGGDVQLDATAEVRSTLDLTMVGSGRWPTRASDPLAPYGNEIHVRRGIRYGNGVTEWVSLGYHRIESPSQDEAPDGPIRVAARDRMAGIIDARLTTARQFPATAMLGEVVDELVQEVYPTAVIEWDDLTSTDALGRAVLCEQERYEFLNELITARGKVWYWDHRGHLVIRDPLPPSSPVFTVNSGAEGVLVSLSREISREGVYNAVIASGEGADTTTPARAVVVDYNPLSPTYWDGAFGKVPRFYVSPMITTDLHAQAAAKSLLVQSLGLPYSVDFTVVPNPALEPGDPVRVVYPGRSEVHVIEQITVPLTANAAMAAATREQTLITLGVL